MLELVEATILAEQLNKTIRGKKVKNVAVAHSPHKFAFFYEDPAQYPSLLVGKEAGTAKVYGGYVEISFGDSTLLFNDGVALRYHDKNEKRPIKHQLFLEFEDMSSISASVQMYGGIFCFMNGEFDNSYYNVAKEKPSPVSEDFDEAYFDSILLVPGMEKLSAKAFLATQQRIPGLGNGTLQDILYNTGIHPKRKISTLDKGDTDRLFKSIKNTLTEMIRLGGRDTEKDLFDSNGGYLTKLSKNTVGRPCPKCGTVIQKEAYLGGSIYYCKGCQK
ncbi:MAG TPA: endonuclease VIII [Mobilitalea sp.]|nr:endonuclease VIII [Mobilitalea sp.]